jgi:hypothetical protein
MKNTLLTSLIILLSGTIMASDPIREFIQRAGDAAKYPGYDLLVLFDSTFTDVETTGLSRVTNHVLYKVLTANGAREMNALTFGYDPQSAYVEVKKATIYRKTGEILPADPAAVLDYSAPARAIYWGAREKMVDIGRLEPGDAVEVVLFRKGFTYALLEEDDDRFIPPMRGHFYDIVEFFGPNPILRKVYQVGVPTDKILQFQFYHGQAQVSAWIENEKTIYTFSSEELMPLKTESRMVAVSDVAPKLLLSTSPDWFTKSKWFYNVNETYGSFESTPEIKAKVDEILRGATTEMDSVSRLTHWCADEIRYSGISMGEGEGFTLHKGAMTFTDRCGVCKDKAGMLITMLRAAGFSSYPAMTMAGSRIDYIPADQFNHCVTIVKLNDGNYHLLDPTWVPFIRELWSSAEQQQQYLMGVPEGADLKTTPVSDAQNHYIRISGNSKLFPDGTLSGTIRITAEGQSDGAVRGFFKNSSQSQWYQNVEREFKRVHPRATITKLDFGNPMDYLSGPIRILAEYTIPGYAVVTGNLVFFTPLTAAQIFKSSQGHLSFETDLKERKYPFRDRCSRELTVCDTIQLPDYLEMIRIPANIENSGESIRFTGGYRLHGNQLVFKETATYGKRIYEAGEWPDFKAAVEAQNRYANQPVIFTIQN